MQGTRFRYLPHSSRSEGILFALDGLICVATTCWNHSLRGLERFGRKVLRGFKHIRRVVEGIFLWLFFRGNNPSTAYPWNRNYAPPESESRKVAWRMPMEVRKRGQLLSVQDLLKAV